MKKILVPLITILVLLGGVFAFVKIKSNSTPEKNPEKYSNAEKIGTTKMKGKITQSEDGFFFIREEGELPKQIDSLSVDLTQYIGQTVSVEGKYSGDILFISLVK